tara:strand:- start:943 stop:1248 length:306 start_codon:yes stop_codon:yes gene_type:complete
MNIDYVVDEYDNTKIPIVNKEKTNCRIIVFVVSEYYNSKTIALRLKGTEKISEIRKELEAIDDFWPPYLKTKLYCQGGKLNDNDYVHESSIRHKGCILLMR